MIATLLAIHIIVTLSLTGIILLQRSEGGALGIGSSPGSMFSGQQSATILTRVTSILAAAFFLLAISIAVLSSRERAENATPPSLFDQNNSLVPELQIPQIPNNTIPEAPDTPTGQKSDPQPSDSTAPLVPPVN